MFVIRFFCLIVFLSLFLFSCFNKYEPVHQDAILESSLPKPPSWIYHDSQESKTQFYFVRSMRSEFNMPMLAYNLVRRDLHVFFEKEAEYILQPVLHNISKPRFNALVQEFKIFLSKKLMNEIRTNRTVYWEKVSYQKNMDDEIGYWYYVLLSLPKQRLRILEKQFISQRLDFARKNRKKLIIKELESSLTIIQTLRDNDALRQSKLPKDYVFETPVD